MVGWLWFTLLRMNRFAGSSVVLGAVAMALVACTAQSSPPSSTSSPQPVPTVTVTATATITVEPVSPDAPDPLSLGTFAKLSTVKTRVLKYDSEDASTSDDERTVSALVETCVTGDDQTSLSWSPWTAVAGDGSRFPALGSTYGDYPKPEYPFAGDEEFRPGECAKGWIVFSSPRKPDMKTIRYSNDAGEIVTWKI